MDDATEGWDMSLSHGFPTLPGFSKGLVAITIVDPVPLRASQ